MTVNSDILNIQSRDAIELLIYCHYLMRLENIPILLGTLTDGRIWDTMKLSIENNMVKVFKVHENISER